MIRSNDDPVDQLGLLIDSLLEHQPDDPDFGPPETWPGIYDENVAMIGAPLDNSECFEPSPEDWQSYEDWLERLEYERGCRMRFA